MRLFLALLIGLGLGGCATTRTSASLDQPDPYEKFNRGVWSFNQAVDRVALKPVTKVYRTVTPLPARRGISNILRNLTEPFSAVNSLLQGKPDRFFNSLGRFVVNSTIGVGGLADHATDIGLAETREDFGQTLANAGARRSPYLVLPVLGSSTVRDAIGTAVQFVADPAGIVISSELGKSVGTGVTVARIVDARSRAVDDGFDTLLESSADSYATARSTFFQRRQAQINDEEGTGASAPSEASEQEQLDKALDEANPDNGAAPQPAPKDPADPKLDSAAIDLSDEDVAGGDPSLSN